MSYPTKYTRQYDYVSYQNSNPNRPLPATKVNADLNMLALLSDEAIEFLKGFTRSDGRLANESVGMDQLEPAIAAMIGDTEVIDELIVASDAAVAAASAAGGSASSASASAASATASSSAASGFATAASNSASAAATSESNAAATLANAVVGVGSSVDSEIMLFNGTGGKTAKRASVTGLLKATSGVLAAATNLVDYFFPAKGADIASATTTNLQTATGDLIDVTGTTTITAITLNEGQMRTVRFTGVLTLTHGASLVLPGAVNVVTAAGDFAVFRGYAAGVVRCVSYTRATGLFSSPNTHDLLESTVAFADRFAITSETSTTVTTISIPSGVTVDATAVVGFETSGGAYATEYHLEISTTAPPTLVTAPNSGGTVGTHATYIVNQGQAFNIGPRRIVGPATAYLKAYTKFGTDGANGSGAQTVYGYLRCEKK